MHVKLLDVRGSSREANIVRARSLSIYLARKLTTLSLLQIGEYFSGRDHSTVLHSIHKITLLLESDDHLANLCRDVQSELLSNSIQ
jgi:chromosomal replication initiator protein